MRAGAGMIAGPAVLGMTGAAMAQQTQPTTTGPATTSPATQPSAGLIDPRDRYPKPPFPKQEQEPPGLASKMTPRPDHGEESYRGSGKLTGRKALLTGGDSGIGRAAAIAFAREGADVAINYLPVEEPDAKEVVDLIRAAGRKAVAIPGDIRDEAFCKQLVERTVSELGGLDLLVNNAAQQRSVDDLMQISSEQFASTFHTNVFAPFWITRAAIPHLKPGACIIMTASVQGYEPSKNLVDYAMTKSCNVSFTKSLSKQLASKGIRVNAIAPGPVWTPLQPSGGQPPEELMKFGEGTPLGRPGQPAELASAYVLLASADSTFTTGEVLSVAGNPSAS
jgi:hypothetical protein